MEYVFDWQSALVSAILDNTVRQTMDTSSTDKSTNDTKF